MKTLMDILEQNIIYQDCILTLSHSDYRITIGGTEKVIRYEANFFYQKNIHYIHIFPHREINELFLLKKNNQIVGINIDNKNIGLFYFDYVVLSLYLLQRGLVLNFLSLHLHHLLGFSLENVDFLLKKLTFNQRIFFIHDYFSACPQHNLMRNGIEYCNISCNDIKDFNYCKFLGRRKYHVSQFETLFSKYPFSFIAPSEIAKKIWGSVYSKYHNTVKVYPHLQLLINKGCECKNTSDPFEKINIAYIGYESKNKGYDIWREFVRLNKDRYLNFFHIGAVLEKIPSVTYIPVQLDENGYNMVSKKLQDHKIQIAFIFSIWPETYAFTLFESLEGGAYIITHHNSGNISAMVKKLDCGMIFNSDTELFSFFSDESLIREKLFSFNRRCITYTTNINTERLFDELDNVKTDMIHDSLCLNKSIDITKYELIANFENNISKHMILILNNYEKKYAKKILKFYNIPSFRSYLVQKEIKVLKRIDVSSSRRDTIYSLSSLSNYGCQSGKDIIDKRNFSFGLYFLEFIKKSILSMSFIINKVTLVNSKITNVLLMLVRCNIIIIYHSFSYIRSRIMSKYMNNENK